jgi:hypothetical protein
VHRPVPARKLLPFLLYVLLFLASFYPQSLHPGDTVAYVGDSLEAVWMLGWNVDNFFRNPLGLFEANILYPNPRPVTFTDHRILLSVLVAPVVWATDNPLLAYNVALALGCLLAAFSARHLAMGLGLGELGSFTAGALYAFHTYQVNEGPRLHIIYHGFLPLVIDQFIRYVRTGAKRHAFAIGGWMLLQGLASSYHVLYGALVLSILCLAVLVSKPKLMLRRTPALAAAAVFAGLLFAPILFTYVDSARIHGFRHELPAGVDLSHYLFTTPTNLVYGAIGEVRLQQRGPHFIGFLSVGLMLFTLGRWLSRRSEDWQDALLPARVWVPGAAVLALVFVALSLGRDMVVFGWNVGPGPYRLLYHYVPGFQQVRIPERLSLVAMLFIALLVGRAIAWMGARGRLGRAAAVLSAVFVPLEHLSPLPHTARIPVGEDVPAVYRWLSDQPIRALIEVPIPGEPLIRKESLNMYFSLYHGKAIIHGYESFPPLLSSFLRKMAMEFPSEASLEALDRIGVDTVIVHHGLPGSERIAKELPRLVDAGRLRLVARFTGEAARVYEGTEDEVYRILPKGSGRPAPYPRGERKRSPGWHYRTKLGDPRPAVDGDLSTSWRVARALRGDEFFEIAFDRPEVVSGLVIRLDRFSHFPTSFKIAGRDPDGEWRPLVWYDHRHKLQLLEGLLEKPYPASVGFDLEERTLRGVRIMVEEGGESFFGWSIPEIEVLVPR